VSDTDWNPLYVEYARENGRTAEEQAAHDTARLCGPMTEFIVWANRRAEASRKATPRP